MKQIIVIGHSSFLSYGIESILKDCEVLRLGHQEWHEHSDSLRKADVIINFCIQPTFNTQELDAENIIDIQIAQVIKDTQTRMIFLSSRKVYGSYNDCRAHDESSPLKPYDPYSTNKATAEKELTNIMGDRLAIFRIANVLGSSIPQNNNGTFIQWVAQQVLSHEKISLAVDKETLKDFITVDYFQHIIHCFIKDWSPGVWNIGSGFATPLSALLNNLVGEGQYAHKKGVIKDQFILNSAKIIHETGLSITQEKLLEHCYLISRDFLKKKAL